MHGDIGAVGALWRYPVKSMLGEQLATARVTERGLPGDRGFALIDRETGKIASAKNPRLWRALLTCHAALVDAAVRITWPDGKYSWSTDADVDETLSAVVGRSVTLTDVPPLEGTLDRSKPDEVLQEGLDAEVDFDIVQFGSKSPEGTFFDYAPLHLGSTAALDFVAAHNPRELAEAQRYRPNIVIDTGSARGFVDNDWRGRELRIGGELVLQIICATPRCAIPTLVHGELPRDTATLRVPAEHNRISPLDDWTPGPCVGVYAQILQPGTIRTGDAVRF